MFAMLIIAVGYLRGLTANEPPESGEGLVQYGVMHEVIGLQKHAGRVPLRHLVERPHFYGVGALEGLTGEITINDGEVTVTRVDAIGQMLPYDMSTGDPSATLLIGSYISAWTEHRVAHDVAVDKLDEYITDLVKQSQRDQLLRR